MARVMLAYRVSQSTLDRVWDEAHRLSEVLGRPVGRTEVLRAALSYYISTPVAVRDRLYRTEEKT